MIVSHESRVLFVHVQKTGGSTVEELLLGTLPGALRVSGLPGGRHSTLRQALMAMPEVRDYYTFGFVRNPWARLVSWHSMIMRRAAAAESNPAVAARVERSRFWSQVSHQFPTFRSFVLEGPDHLSRISRPQLRYLEAPAKQADFIGRTEHLETDLGRAFAQLGHPPPPSVRRTNSGPRVDYRQFYDDESRERVAQLYAEDIARFDYQFEPS